MPDQTGSILALDYGAKRIGLALASAQARLATPLSTIANDNSLESELKRIMTDNNVTQLVVGRPRGLEGQSTNQTNETEAFASKLQQLINLPVDMQDETLTSQKAEAELRQRAEPYAASDIDALAATYILEDWLKEHKI